MKRREKNSLKSYPGGDPNESFDLGGTRQPSSTLTAEHIK